MWYISYRSVMRAPFVTFKPEPESVPLPAVKVVRGYAFAQAPMCKISLETEVA